jgi:sigma-B regulation protein RsbU (phosphoserine phosphatase)
VWRAIPLLIPGRKPVGVVTVCNDLLGDGFLEQRERDLQLMGYLNQAARAIQAVSTRRRELALAGRMQTSLLPRTPPDLDKWQIAATLRPARETSGDFYDFVALSDGKVGVVIADVADKGMGAALYMALSRTLIRTYAVEYPSRPDLALNAANERILADTDATMFVTVVYGILDPATGSFVYCNAGHHPPYLFDGSEAGPAEALPGSGMPLGIVEDARLERNEVRLDPGTALLLYTDGVVDARSPEKEFFGRERMLEAVQETLDAPSGKMPLAREMQEALLENVFGFMGDEPQFDDVTLMVVARGE